MTKRQAKKMMRTIERKAVLMAERIFSLLPNGSKLCLRADDYDNCGTVYTAVEFFFCEEEEQGDWSAPGSYSKTVSFNDTVFELVSLKSSRLKSRLLLKDGNKYWYLNTNI